MVRFDQTNECSFAPHFDKIRVHLVKRQSSAAIPHHLNFVELGGGAGGGLMSIRSIGLNAPLSCKSTMRQKYRISRGTLIS